MAGFVIGEMVKMVLVPGSIVLVGCLALGRLPARFAAGAGAACLLVAYGASHALIAGWPGFPPGEALHWIPWLGAAAVIVSLARRGRTRVLVLVPVAAAVVAALMLRLEGFYGWSPVEMLSWLAGTGAGLVVFWSPWWSGGGRPDLLPGPLAILAGGAAAAAIFSHTAKLAELSASLAVGLAVLAALGLWRLPGLRAPLAPFSAGGALAGWIMLGAMLVYAQHYVEMPLYEVGLLSLGSLTFLLSGGRWVARQPYARALLIQVLLALVPTALALVLAWARYRVLAADPYAGY